MCIDIHVPKSLKYTSHYILDKDNICMEKKKEWSEYCCVICLVLAIASNYQAATDWCHFDGSALKENHIAEHNKKIRQLCLMSILHTWHATENLASPRWKDWDRAWKSNKIKKLAMLRESSCLQCLIFASLKIMYFIAICKLCMVWYIIATFLIWKILAYITILLYLISSAFGIFPLYRWLAACAAIGSFPTVATARTSLPLKYKDEMWLKCLVFFTEFRYFSYYI